MTRAITRYRLVSEVSLLFFSVVMAYLLSSLVAVWAVSWGFGLEMNDQTTDALLNHPQGRLGLFGVQALIHATSFWGVAYLFWRREKQRTDSVLPLSSWDGSPLHFLGIALAGMLLFPLIQTLAVWNQSWDIPGELGVWARQAEENAQRLIAFLTQFDSFGVFLLGIFVMAVLPAVGEELLFRGLLQNQLKGLFGNRHVAVWLGALIFSAVHFQFYGFVGRALLGLWFGYLYERSGSLRWPIWAHFFHNGFTLLLLYLHQQGFITTDINQDDYPSIYSVIGATLLAGMAIFALLTPHTRHAPRH